MAFECVEWATREKGGECTESGVGTELYTWRLEGKGMKIEVRGKHNENRRVRVREEGRMVKWC
jgi:hypothetical protein